MFIIQASKLCDFYDMLDINSITFAKRSVVWRGAFTLMLVYVDRNIDISFLADRLAAAFTSVVRWDNFLLALLSPPYTLQFDIF